MAAAAAATARTVQPWAAPAAGGPQGSSAPPLEWTSRRGPPSTGPGHNVGVKEHSQWRCSRCFGPENYDGTIFKKPPKAKVDITG
eukprot:2905288-Pyramimonas_sp.AAC.1